MPKQKTRKSLTKRFRVTKTGKVLRAQSNTGHLKSKKSSKRKRRLSGVVKVKGAYAKKIKKFTGYKKKQSKGPEQEEKK